MNDKDFTRSACIPQAESRRYWIHRYGCQMNVHDSEIYAGQFQALGYAPADSPDDADVILVNTCSVREKAEEKLFSELGRLRPLQSRRRDGSGSPVKIGVTGCIAQQRGAGILERESSVDFVLGTRAIRALPAVLAALDAGDGPQVVTDDRIDFDAADAQRTDRVKAFVTIMEGCNNYCSFCIVPSTRGLEIYRRGTDIVNEITGLALRGYREVTLLGQNVNSWSDPDRDLDFPELLQKIDRQLTASAVPGIERVRFLTSHPKDLSPRLIEVMARCPTIAEHIHLPVQSGSDRVLHRMNRQYTRAGYLRLVGRLRAAIPDVGLSTDLIVGFPGETEEDFAATMELVRRARYDSFYSFEYSPRPATAAIAYEDTVAPEDKRRRLIALQELQRNIQAEKNAAWTGKTVEVLVDGVSKMSEQEVSGRTATNHIVNFPGDTALIGHLVDVRITRHAAHSLHGAGAATFRERAAAEV